MIILLKVVIVVGFKYASDAQITHTGIGFKYETTSHIVILYKKKEKIYTYIIKRKNI